MKHHSGDKQLVLWENKVVILLFNRKVLVLAYMKNAPMTSNQLGTKLVLTKSSSHIYSRLQFLSKKKD